jgi:hypothetical protein
MVMMYRFLFVFLLLMMDALHGVYRLLNFVMIHHGNVNS